MHNVIFTREYSTCAGIKLPLSCTVVQSWTEFEEQLHWYLAGAESSSKSDKTNISIMIVHVEKEARKVYKTLLWNEEMKRKVTNGLRMCQKHFNALCSKKGYIIQA